MSVENFFPEHYPWQRLLAVIAAGSEDEMNIGNPVVCMYENYTEPVVDGYASAVMVFHGISYKDNIICESNFGFSNTSIDGAFASGLTLIERIWGSVTFKFYDTEVDVETGKYTSVEEIDVDYDTQNDDEYTVCKIVIPELEEAHVFAIYVISGE